MADNSCAVTFKGHKNAITTLAFDAQGTRLASGSLDTEIVVWDVPGECGLVRLHGHKNAITSVSFLGDNSAFLLSGSKDALVKLWDLQTQHCIQTLVNHRSEVWSLAVATTGTRFATGCADNQIRIWKIHSERLGLAQHVAPSNDSEGAVKVCCPLLFLL